LDKILAAGLSFAAGVMLYVSFVEIFTVKAVDSFKECFPEPYAYLYATLSFFGGIVIAWLLMVLVHFIQKQMLKHAKNAPALKVDEAGQMNEEVQEYLEMQRTQSREDLLGFKDEEKLELTILEGTAEEVSAIVAVDQVGRMVCVFLYFANLFPKKKGNFEKKTSCNVSICGNCDCDPQLSRRLSDLCSSGWRRGNRCVVSGGDCHPQYSGRNGGVDSHLSFDGLQMESVFLGLSVRLYGAYWSSVGLGRVGKSL
jgi:hypothetical protein